MNITPNLRRIFIAVISVGLATIIGAPMVLASSEALRPNIILIMCDDMGYSDIGCYGGEIETPNIDTLAKQGMRFTQFYNCGKCAPTRAALLTGLYSQQTGCTGPPVVLKNGVTIAEVLRQAGYRTLMTGKWHTKQAPLDRGFDRFFGGLAGGFDYFNRSNEAYVIDNKVHQPYIPQDKDFYTTDAFTDQAVKYLDEYKNEKKPFFLYIAYNAPHFPLQARQKDIDKYKGKYDMGWDKLRSQRYKRMIDMGLIKPQWKLSERDPEVPAWKNIKDKKAAVVDMEVYAAMVDSMDQNIGKVLTKLKEIGKEDNTLIMFLSDNGACSESRLYYDNTVKSKHQIPGPYGKKSRLGIAWANATNTPLYKYKRWNSEGGIATPFVVRWPQVIKKTGTITPQVGHIIDIMATCLDIAGAKYPVGEIWKTQSFINKTKSSWKVLPHQGKSLLPIFQGNQREKHDSLYWYFNGNAAVRKGKWKLVRVANGEVWLEMKDNPWKLYDMEKDPTETNDLAANYPELANSLKQQFLSWANNLEQLNGFMSHRYFQPIMTQLELAAEKKLLKDPKYLKLFNKRQVIKKELSKAVKQNYKGKRKPLNNDLQVASWEHVKDPLIKEQYQKYQAVSKEIENYLATLGKAFQSVWQKREKMRFWSGKDGQ